MAKAVLYPLGILLMLTGFGNAVDPNCYYKKTLESGISYFVFNREYPDNSTGPRSCRWEARSNYRIKLTCGVFNLPQSSQCAEAVLAIKSGDDATRRYCGDGMISVESRGNEMIIEYIARSNSSPGRFSCHLQAIDEIQESDNCRCGFKKPTRIVGGSETGVNEYPMMAGLVDFSLREVYCGATIISQKYVLTAAHCVIDRSTETMGVLVGDHNLRDGLETNASRLLRAQNYVIHPQYVTSKIAYDIAIVAVDGVIEFTNEVGPACLPFQHDRDSFAGDLVDILGWGTTEFAGPKSDVLLKTRVNVITTIQCERNYNDVTRAQLCTLRPGHDACQFDSGGPVLWQNPTTMKLLLVGIISFGGICGSNAPGVNTRVGKYMDWIAFNTLNTTYCMSE